MAAHKKVVKKLDTIWECPDDLWENVVVPVLEALDPPVNNGRPRIDPRRALNGIIHQMRGICQWNHLPRNSATIPRCIAPFNAGPTRGC